MAAKNKMQDALDKMASSLKNARGRARAAAQRASDMTGEVLRDLVTLATTGAAGWANGYMDNYQIFGVDAALALGLPIAIGGIALSMFGFGEIGQWVGAVGKGLLGAYAFKRLYLAGWASAHPEEAKAGQPPTLRGDPSVLGLPQLQVDMSPYSGVRTSTPAGAYRT